MRSLTVRAEQSVLPVACLGEIEHQKIFFCSSALISEKFPPSLDAGLRPPVGVFGCAREIERRRESERCDVMLPFAYGYL